MADALHSSPASETSALAPLSTAEQLQQANRRLLVANRELDSTNEQLRVANEQLQTCNEKIRTQTAELRRLQKAVQQLNTELALINAGLADTIADSLQAAEFAFAEAEAQRQRLHRCLAEAPAMIAVLTGPDHVVELANDHFRALLGYRELVGRPFGQVVPELAGQPFFCHLAQVYRTGETYTGTDVPLALRPPAGRPAPLFATCILQATRDGAGHIDGLLVFAYGVAEQVRAR